jgi:hypothetical protein
VRFIGPCIVYINNGLYLHFALVLFNHPLSESLQIEMGTSPDIPLPLRAVIIAYRFDLGWQYAAIAKQLSLNYEAIKSLCQRVKKRCEDAEQRQNTDRLDLLLRYIDYRENTGRKPRAEPGSALALAVRRGLEEYECEERPIAANQGIKKRQALGELDPNIRPLDRKQIIHITEDTEHC